MATENSIWKEVLQSFTVQELLGDDFELKQVESTATLPEVLEVLTKNKIQCVPVWDNEDGKYVGLLDIVDILSLVTLISDCKGLVDVASRGTATWDAFWAQENQIIKTVPIRELCNISERNPWVPVDIATPLYDILGMFGRGVGLKRIPVIDEDGFMRGFVTQTAITDWLHRSLTLISEEVLKKKIADCPLLGTYNVETIGAEVTALDAFKKILQEKISALAVVSSTGALIGCISASDLKGSEGLHLFTDLSVSVANYLTFSSERFQRVNALNPIAVTHNSTIGDVLNQIHTHHVHRVFVIDDYSLSPQRVISLTDLLTFLQSF